MKKQKKRTRGKRRPAKKNKLRRAAAGLVCLLAALALATGLLYVDNFIRSTMLPSAPAILRGEEEAPLRYRLEVLGQDLHLDLTGPADFLEEAAALLSTPPAPVRAGLWLWLRVRG